jgi:hypothetical protein
MMVILAALTVFLTVTVGLLWAAVRIERSAAADFERGFMQGKLADQFRADVAGASAAEIPGDARPLTLQGPDKRTIVYRWDGEKLERSAGDTKETLALGVEQSDVQFARSVDGRTVVLRILETRGQGTAQRIERVEIAAALGGDLR